MRRIYACVLVLGIMGTLGFGVVRGLAQTEGPALTPNQLKPANYSAFQGNPVAAAPVPDNGARPTPTVPAPIPEINIPFVAPTTGEAMPPIAAPPIPDITPGDPQINLKGVVAPPSGLKAEQPVPTPSAPMAAPIVEPDQVLSKPTVQSPTIERLPSTTLPEFSDSKRIPPQSLPVMTPSHPPVDAGKPGSNRVVPAVSIESIAPDSVRFGQQISYEILVKNEGAVPVTSVRVDEELGKGTKIISSFPAGEVNGDKAFWTIGALGAGEEKRIKINVMPGNEGDLNTRPHVSYSAGTAMTVRVSRPNLVVSVTNPESALVGDEVPMQVVVTNNGTGDSGRIVLNAVLSEGLKHSAGSNIEAVIARLAPGESSKVTLKVNAAVPGEQTCALSAVTEGTAKAVKNTRLDVRQPKLNLAIAGPVKCMVRAKPTFTIDVSNPGTCATEPVQLAAAFPEGLDFVSASNGGTYDAASRTVMWNLGQAAANSKRQLTVETKSSVAGHLAVRVAAQAGPKLHARAEAVIHAEGVPSLFFEVVDLEDPIEVGKETTYEIRVSNTGSTACTNVKLSVGISEGLVVGAVTSSLPHKIVGQTLIFEPIAKMPVKADLVIRVRARGTVAGDQRFKVQLACDQFKQPVVKEESTSFFQQ